MHFGQFPALWLFSKWDAPFPIATIAEIAKIRFSKLPDTWLFSQLDPPSPEKKYKYGSFPGLSLPLQR